MAKAIENSPPAKGSLRQRLSPAFTKWARQAIQGDEDATFPTEMFGQLPAVPAGEVFTDLELEFLRALPERNQCLVISTPVYLNPYDDMLYFGVPTMPDE